MVKKAAGPIYPLAALRAAVLHAQRLTAPLETTTVPTPDAFVETVESLDPADLRPLLESGATQCGACTSGVAMTACWIHDHPEILETHSLAELMAGNLCRCTGYDGILKGIEAGLESRDRLGGGAEA